MPIIEGTFNVQLTPAGGPNSGNEGAILSRMILSKTFEGPLKGKSSGEMLSAMTEQKGSAGYVAIEKFVGSLNGHSGTFVLQHFGIMKRGEDRLILEVVPDSATGELSGLKGSMNILIDEGKHYYTFDYQISDSDE